MYKSVNNPDKIRNGWIFPFVVFLFIVCGYFLNQFYEYQLHQALGYGSVFVKNLMTGLIFRVIGALICFILSLIAARSMKHLIPSVIYRTLQFVAGFFGFLIGYSLWYIDPTELLLFFKHVDFSNSDPLLHLNYTFYIFQLPVLMRLLEDLLITTFIFLIANGLCLFYLLFRQNQVTETGSINKKIMSQTRKVTGTLCVLFVLFSGLAFVSRYLSLVSGGNSSLIFGPDYVTDKLYLNFFSWLQVLSLLITAYFFAKMTMRPDRLLPSKNGLVGSPVWKQMKGPIYAFASFVGISILSGILGVVLNSLYVHPNQNTVELPYIQHTIDATRFGLGIDHVQTKPFQPLQTLSQDAVKQDQATLQNVRINDQGQTTTILNQLQSFKNYFQFQTANVDRYQNQEVYASVRQMDVDKVPVQTWVNRSLVYTHGYGIAINPVNQFDADGLPVLWAKNTPQQTVAPIPAVTRPEIYFGQMDNNVIAPSKQPEFDYPVGSVDHSSHYQGGYGLPVKQNRLLLTLMQGNLQYFTSDQITHQSLFLFDRNIDQRVRDIAPFLRYDQNAYTFVDQDGHIKWVLDAFTDSAYLPYAETFMGTTYIRNSVKVVMDAYTGETTFYVVDPKDPIIQSEMALYPGLFKTDIPADVAQHFKYPQDLFQAQATALTRYHMTDAASFYNQEDLWDLANQIYQQNETAPRPPVYQMLRMPGQTTTHFVLSELFTPAHKDNLNGWLIADHAPGHYGELTIYQFPQSSLIFGPMQAENQIDSNPAISAQLSLWNQQGSHVVRGDILLIPVGDTILYVEPIYLVANRQNSLPQLERVVIDFNKSVYMDDSLDATLNDLLQGIPPQTGINQTQPKTPGVNTDHSSAALAKQASQMLEKYKQDTAKGDFNAAGKDLSELADLLSQLSR